MPKFKVTATMDVGYTAFVEADNQEEAWSIARGEGWQKPIGNKLITVTVGR